MIGGGPRMGPRALRGVPQADRALAGQLQRVDCTDVVQPVPAGELEELDLLFDPPLVAVPRRQRRGAEHRTDSLPRRSGAQRGADAPVLRV